MKRWVKQVGSIMIAGALLTGSTALVGLSGATEVHAAEAAQQNLLTVLGKGEISVKPDIVYLSIGPIICGNRKIRTEEQCAENG